MVSYLVPKDKRFRLHYKQMEGQRTRLRFFLNNGSIAKVRRQSLNMIFLRKLKKLLAYSVKSRNRCLLSGRAGSVFRNFRLSRINLKNLASRGLLTGVRKSSW